MPETVLQTPFGAVRLIADGGEATQWTPAAPKLPKGQRVDACHIAEIRRSAGAAAEIAVVLEWDAPADADIGPDSGELLEASSLDTGDLTATVATRDGEWIEAQPGLRLVEKQAVLHGGGRNVNRALVSEGLAWASRSADGATRGAQALARGARRGLWASACPVPPWRWRKASERTRRKMRRCDR